MVESPSRLRADVVSLPCGSSGWEWNGRLQSAHHGLSYEPFPFVFALSTLRFWMHKGIDFRVG